MFMRSLHICYTSLNKSSESSEISDGSNYIENAQKASRTGSDSVWGRVALKIVLTTL